MCAFIYIFSFFNLILFFNFTILYGFAIYQNESKVRFKFLDFGGHELRLIKFYEILLI